METLTTVRIVNISTISRSFFVSLDNPLSHLPHWSPTPRPQTEDQHWAKELNGPLVT